jgi:hypothetical protein
MFCVFAASCDNYTGFEGDVVFGAYSATTKTVTVYSNATSGFLYLTGTTNDMIEISEDGSFVFLVKEPFSLGEPSQKKVYTLNANSDGWIGSLKLSALPGSHQYVGYIVLGYHIDISGEQSGGGWGF